MGLIPRLNSGHKREEELKIIVRVIVNVVFLGGRNGWVDGKREEGGVLFAGRARKEKKKGRDQRKKNNRKNKKKNTVSSRR